MVLEKRKNGHRQRILEELYSNYNRVEYIDPDPLVFLHDYPDLCDREIVGFIASSLSYGQVKQIMNSVSIVLKLMKPSPYSFLMKSSSRTLNGCFQGFKHRFTTGDELSSFLYMVKLAIKRYGSLQECFYSSINKHDNSIIPALCEFTRNLSGKRAGNRNSLLPVPERGSACKRLNLFLRWMVRKDDVDPGGWDMINPSKLIVPLDIHMHRLCRSMGFTVRRNACIKTALEITEAFKMINPEDPVKYDFALTRLGIRRDTNMDDFINKWLHTGLTHMKR